MYGTTLLMSTVHFGSPGLQHNIYFMCVNYFSLNAGVCTALKPATGRPCVPAFLVSGTVPAFMCDCLRFACAFAAT